MQHRLVFVGNRRFVLEKIMQTDVNLVVAIVVEGSHLHIDINNGVLGQLDYISISSKTELINVLNTLDYDVLLSNGCPFILPISELSKAIYTNIHPSCLPDLRGVDPVIGAILYRRDGGATCHIMDEGIDTGDIISQVRIPFSEDIDVTTLYQMSFIAEAEVFEEALKLNFKSTSPQFEEENIIYYSRSPEDWKLNFNVSNEDLVQKIKAFNNESIGCEFKIDGSVYKVFSVQRIKNEYVRSVVMRMPEGVVVLSYENNILFHKDNEILRFMGITSLNDKAIAVGSRIF